MAATNIDSGIALDDLLHDLVDEAQLAECEQIRITSLSQDNRKVQEGCLFIACQGFNTHGLMYAIDAVNNGAAAVVWEGDCDRREEILDQISNKVVCVECDDLKSKVGEIASRFYGKPSHQLDVIGITGTDGKTSIAHYIAQALDSYDVHCGILGTLGNGFINDLHPTGLTTADALQIQSALAEIQAAGSKHVVMEVSSHGLDQGRVNAVEFDTAVFSNLAQDHLDYHETREDYAAAKRKLFFMPGLKAAVINLDDDYGRQLATECKQHLCVWGYSTEDKLDELSQFAEFVVYAKSVKADEDGLRISVVSPKGSGQIRVGLLGHFNASNVLAAFASLLLSGMAFEDAVQQVQAISPVSGRMQRVVSSNEDAATVIIDYAHTPQALEAACCSVREHFDKQFWCVFGCGGGRDKSKRPLMAAAVEKYADHVVLTSDNPRHENPDDIIAQTNAGFTSADKSHIEPDRKRAIAYALQHAGKGDVVLVAGKGHESSQIVGDVHIAFNDYRVAQELLEAST